MNINIPDAEWTRYRFISNQNVVAGGFYSHSAALYPICCFYKYDYFRSRGKYADYDMYCSYRYTRDLCSCREKMDDFEYDKALSLLETIGDKHPNSLVFFPQRVARNWDKYRTFHFNYFVQLLNKANISYSFDINELQSNNLLNTNAETVVIFELTTDAKTIEKNTNDIVKKYNQRPPCLLYISFFTEVTNRRGTIYFKEDNIGRMFKKR